MSRHRVPGGVCMLLAAICFSGPAVPRTSSVAAAGASIAAAGTPNGGTACVTCHGPRGEGVAAFPRLAGLGDEYLRRQLDAFADGSRKNPMMQPIAQALTPEQRAQVAAYFSRLPYPLKARDERPRAAADVGAWLATRGRWADDLPACDQCHGPGGSGVGANFPALGGQPAVYIAEQLKSWQTGLRPSGPLGLMESVARRLTAADIQAVSEYYAAMGKQLPAAPAPAVSATASKGAG